MFEKYFGSIADGRIARLGYLGWSLLLIVVLFGAVFVAIAVVGLTERLMSGDLEHIQANLRQHFAIPVIVAYALIFAVVLFAHLNLMAKRIRDMGLNGWLVVLGLVAVAIILGFLAETRLGQGFNGLIWLGLVLIPSDTFSTADKTLNPD